MNPIEASKRCLDFAPGSDLVVLTMNAVAVLARNHLGLPARAMLYHLFEIESVSAKFAPTDVSDFKRCLEVLTELPELREKLSEMSAVSEEWNWVIENWSALELAISGRASDDSLRWVLENQLEG